VDRGAREYLRVALPDRYQLAQGRHQGGPQLREHRHHPPLHLRLG
jgi:hypothetical protein